jgi:aminoglycoside phosphotransferase family enzyme/predicted kinase
MTHPHIPADEAAIVAFLNCRESYPEHTDSVEHVQTHISHVFLTDDHAYKLKKHVTFDFLDFATLEQRRQACAEELRINRRLAKEVYLDVLPISQDLNGNLSFSAAGEIVDWVVKMKRLPAQHSMEAMLATGKLTAQHVSVLAKRLFEFYRTLPRLELTADEHRRVMFERTLANREHLLSPAMQQDAATVKRIHAVQLHALQLRDDWFAERVRSGLVVDGHGDLRLEHVYFLPEPVAIDGIEFNAAYRRIDELDELCFLAMECDARNAPQVGDLLLNHYGELAGDHPPPEFIAHYKAYRACVRGKVIGFRAGQVAGNEREQDLKVAKQFIALADGYIRPYVKPAVYLVRGLSGTGKSVVSRGLAQALGCELLQTDVLRQEIITTNDRQERYSPESRARVYAAMFERATSAIAQGLSVVLDGTFLTQAQRHAARAWAQQLSTPIYFLRTHCDPLIAKQRVENRLATGNDASEIQPSLLTQQQLAEEPDAPDLPSVVVDTSGSEADSVQNALHAIRTLVPIARES